MIRFLLLVLVSTLVFNVNAQTNSIEFKLGAVCPLIHDLEHTANTQRGVPSAYAPGYTQYSSSIGALQENYSSNLSYNAEVVGHFSLSKKVTMSFGLGIQYLKFNRENLVIVNDNSGDCNRKRFNK